MQLSNRKEVILHNVVNSRQRKVKFNKIALKFKVKVKYAHFCRLVELTRTHYPVNLHRNLIGSFFSHGRKSRSYVTKI